MISTSSKTPLNILLLLLAVVQLPSTFAQVTSCSPGSYLSSGSCIACTDYTLGQCPGGTSVQTTCAAGQSPTYDFTSCVTTPTACSDGYLLIAYSQASVCQPCFLPLSNGNFANNICVNNVSTTCTSSTFANANATQCVAGISLTYLTPGCPFGEYIGNRVCRTCPSGKVCPGNFFPPYSCGTGRVLSADKTTCVWDGTTTCPAGTWSPIAFAGPVGAVTDPYCMSCPENTICLGGSALPTACPFGSWPNSTSGASTCIIQTTCSPGTFLQDGGCPPCPPGYFCAGGTSQPATCPSGQYPALPSNSNTANPLISGMSTCAIPTSCVTGQFFNATGCFPCPNGAVCAGGSSSLITCPNAQSCPSATTCSEGSFLDNGVCYKCVNDYFICSGGTSTPVAVPDGYYVGGTFSWSTPYEGHFANALPTSCPVGKYLRTASTNCPSPTSICDKRGCIDCPAGHVCSGGTSVPVLCTGGTIPNWNSTLGAIKGFCVQRNAPCPAGFVSTSVSRIYDFLDRNPIGSAALSGLFYQPSCILPLKTIDPFNSQPSPKIYTDVAPGGFMPELTCQLLYSANDDNTSCILTPPTCPQGFYGVSDPNYPLLRNPLFNQQAYGYGPGWITNPSKCVTCEGQFRFACPGGSLPAPRTSCPNGHIRSDNFTTCIPAVPAPVSGYCPAGSYQSGWMASWNSYGYVCQPCPEGSMCGGNSGEIPVKCGVGKVPSVNATLCNWNYPDTCAGTYNSNASTCVWDGVTTCPAGTFGNSASRVDSPYCHPCPMFAICAGGNVLPIGCPFGTGPNPTSTACVIATSCSAGMFLSYGRCSYCPVGYACAGGSADPVLCPFNLVPMDANSIPALPANKDYVAIGERQGGFPAVSCGLPSSCPSSFFLNSTGCWPCPPGMTCPGGNYLPRNCSSTGLSYSNCPSPPQPAVCPAGQILDQYNNCLNPRTTCSAGQYLSNGLCLNCPAYNAICPGGTASFTLCPVGKVRGNNQICVDIPTSCEPGFSIGAEIIELSRPAGFIWTGSPIPAYKMVCESCRTALFCPGGFMAARHCPEHSAPNVAQTSCMPYTATCPIGTSYRSYNGNGGINSLYWSYFSNAIYAHGVIGAGNRASQEIYVCEKCSGSSRCPGGFKQGVAQSCPWGTQPNFNHTLCVPILSCPAGQKSGYGVCSACPTGPYYCTGGSSAETSCGTGKVPNAGATACVHDGTTVCAAGTYINPVTSSNNPYCASCTAGNACAGGSSSPSPCVAGQIVNSGATACAACPSGLVCTGGSSPASACGTGKVPNVNATACVYDGTTVCAAGTYINPSTSVTSPYCAACTAGNSCAGGSVAPVACVAGQFVNSGATACAACPSGLVCTGGSSPATACGTGKVPNVNASACVHDGTTVCAAGTFINPITTTTVAYCANCTAGNVCAGGSVAPAPCPAGQYLNSGASACFIPTSCNVGDYVIGSTGCFPCPSGSSCAGGTAAAVACGAGQLPNVAKSACVASASTCPWGNFLYKVSSSDTSGICLSCPSVPGMWLNCPGGTGGLSCLDHINYGYTCKKCPPDYNKGYCNGGIDSSYIYCRAGSGQVPEYMIDDLGNDCIEIPSGICPEGTYEKTTTGGIKVCDECPRGKFCPGKGAGARTCPPSQYPNRTLIPDQILRSRYCRTPSTTCFTGSTLVNGVCVGSGALTPVDSGTTTPSTALVTKCQAAVQSAITGGGANAYAYIEFASWVPGGEWRCILIVPGTCSQVSPFPSYSSAIATSLCGSASSSCNINTNVGEFSVRGNGVSGGSCSGGSVCSGSPPTTGCTAPAFYKCVNGAFVCVSSGVTVGCTNNPNTVTCTTPGNTVQCLTGSSTYTCEPAETCAGPGAVTISKTVCPGSVPICTLSGKWACLILTCSNTKTDLDLTCSGQSGGPCITECTEWLCLKNKICSNGTYLNYPLVPPLTPGQYQSSGFNGTCISPAAGSLSCPAGQFLVASPVSMSSAPSSTNVPPAMSLQCVPCPTGYTCAGGTGAMAYASPSTSGISACPPPPSGLLSVIGYSAGVSYAGNFMTGQLTSSSTSTNICYITAGLTVTVPGYYNLHPLVGCDPNFLALTLNLGYTFRSYCIPCPTGTFSPGGFVRRCSACPGTPPDYGSCPAGQTLKCSSGAWSCQASNCSASGGGGSAACVAGSTWSLFGTAPCAACLTCSGPNRTVSTTCSATSDTICGCDSGSTKNAAGTGCLATAVVVMPYAISSPTLCSAAGVVESVLNPTTGVALSLRGNLSVALGIPSSSAFIVAITACDSKTTLVAQNAPINTAIVTGGISGRRLQTAALNTSSLNLVIDGQTLVITLGFTIPNSVAPAMSAFLSASMSGTASPSTIATLAGNLQQSIQNSGAASSPQLSSLLADISEPSSSSSSSSSNAASAFSKRLNSVPVSAAAPIAASLGVSVASLGITNNTVKGVPSAIAVTGNPLAVAPTVSNPSPSGPQLSCPAGSWIQAGMTRCVLCSPGTYSSANSTECTPCPIGTYGNIAGLTTDVCSGSCPSCTSPGMSHPPSLVLPLTCASNTSYFSTLTNACVLFNQTNCPLRLFPSADLAGDRLDSFISPSEGFCAGACCGQTLCLGYSYTNSILQTCILLSNITYVIPSSVMSGGVKNAVLGL